MGEERALIVQGDGTLLSEVASPRHPELRQELSRFAELVKAPEHMYTWRLTPLSVWNAAAAGMTADDMSAVLVAHSRYPVPAHILREVRELADRYGVLQLRRMDERLFLSIHDATLSSELAARSSIAALLGPPLRPGMFEIAPSDRGRLKHSLIKLGYPVEDLAGYTPGAPMSVRLREKTLTGESFGLRPYQQEAAELFYASGGERGGSGVIVLPCGAGKTVVGMGIMSAISAQTLILTPSTTAARQWRSELLDKTTLTEDDIGIYVGADREVCPVTIATYQMLTHRSSREADFTHLGLFSAQDWGLVIYDEVHLLPAPVFQVTAGIQARRRLGLTATLVREDGRQDDVFALVGPKRYDVPWRLMEQQGWIARAACVEVRVPFPDALRRDYVQAPTRQQPQLAADNPDKVAVVRALLDRHPGAPALVMGTYVQQLRALAAALGAPLLTGRTSQKSRELLYGRFRDGEIPALVVSKVANFAVDLPDAALAVQVSGSFGSRQEEAQRLGRLLRPKPGDNRAWFYSLVSADTVERDFAMRRQLFLVEQGYSYTIEDSEDVLAEEPT